MKSLEFTYISAQNFLCFGPEGIEINFKDFSNIVLIKGSNLDIKDEIDDKTSSNGVGKSSIPEIIVYTLFGKTIKHPKKITHKDVINNQIGKNLKTEVVWGNYRIVRTRKPDSLRIWEDSSHIWSDDSEITLGGIPATQKLIEEKIGLNYETFVNLIVFTDNNAGSFLECDSSDKRQIVENLLSLDKYRSFADKAKELKKDKKDSIKSVSYEYETLLNQNNQIKNRLEATKKQEIDWKIQKESEIKNLENKLLEFKKNLSSTNEGQEISLYLDAQKEIEEINISLSDLQDNQSKIEKVLDLAKNKLSDTNRELNSLDIKLDNIDGNIEKIKSNIEDCKKEISRLENNKGSKCKFCLGEISEKNYKKYVEEIKNKIKELESDMEGKELDKNSFTENHKNLENNIKKLNKGINSAKLSIENNNKKILSNKKRLQELNKIQKPENKNINNKIIEEKINNIKEQIENKNEEYNNSPFIKIIDSISEDLKVNNNTLIDKKNNLEILEKEIPYYDFWVTAFGDSGIRKFVIEGIIPALNSRIAYWLQYLIDGKIKLEFNNELEEIIERNPSDGDPFVYHAMSGGERRRLNLAVSQAFAYVMSLNSGICPSLVFLDEVTTNIDPIGVMGVYNMILELSKDRKVFITTHDQNLLDLLEGCDLIKLEKKFGLTKIKK